MKSEIELDGQTTRRMDSLQMLSMCATRSSLAAEASRTVFAFPCNSVFSFNHALLTENKDSVNGTGLGFTVWG